MATFLFQGVRPRTLWEAARARRATWTAAAVWGLPVALLAAILSLR